MLSILPEYLYKNISYVYLAPHQKILGHQKRRNDLYSCRPLLLRPSVIYSNRFFSFLFDISFVYVEYHFTGAKRFNAIEMKF